MLRLLVMMALVCLLAAPPAAAGNPFGPNHLRAPGNGQGDRYEQAETRQDRLTRQRQQGRILPLGTIINAVSQQIPGRFLDARFREGRRPKYDVIWRTPKGKRIVTVDARTAQILRVR